MFGINDRHARRVLARALRGRPWRGRLPTVRNVPSRGGNSGLALEVHRDSLLEPSAPPSNPAVPSVATPALPSPRACEDIAMRHEIIQPVLKLPRGSAGRALAVAEAARRTGKSERTISQWIADHQKNGLGGLARKARSDRGRRMYHITRAWDRAVDFDEATKEKIAEEIELYTRRVWASSTDIGWRRVARFASKRLADITRDAGFRGDNRELKPACKLSQRFVMRHYDFRAVAIHDLDAKQWNDKHRSRIRRIRDTRQPMDILIGDVHHLDVLLPRPDGSVFTAKLIAFEDWATARVFLYPVFLPKGEGVRQEHIVEAVVAMTQDPQWGLAQLLYIDNGGEYGCAELAADALELNRLGRSLAVYALDDDPELAKALRRRRGAAIKAKPYNASAKSIEGTFNVLGKGVFSLLPGWIGGIRMAKKTANVGQAPTPYPHGEAAFREDLRNCVLVYETHPKTGLLAGRSPRQVFEEAIAAGWKRTDVERSAMLWAFARKDSRLVSQGRFKYASKGRKSRSYTSPEIQGLPARKRLRLRVPIFGSCDQIPVMNEDGSLFCIAWAEDSYDVIDAEGARESARRLATAKGEIKRKRAIAPPLDMRAELAELAEREGPGRTPESAGTIRLDPGTEAIGRVMEIPPPKRRADEDEDEEILWKRRDELTRRFLGKTGTDG